jgi:signal recognition particle receptor subunit beta
LFACTKSDLEVARLPDTIKNLLARELDLLRQSRTVNLEGIDSEATDTFLGYEGKEFQFEHLEQETSWIACSAKHSGGADAVSSWLLNL